MKNMKFISNNIHIYYLCYSRYSFLIVNILFIIYQIFTINYVLCDDNDLVPLVGVEGNGENTGSERNPSRSYSNDPVYRAYKPYVLHPLERIDENTVSYQAYDRGLQSTTAGYRYELSGDSCRYELGGKPINPTYLGTDLDGNYIYSYFNERNGSIAYATNFSSELGVIEPNRSEVLNKGFYKGGPRVIPVDTSNPTLKRRIFNKVKVTIKNHIAKSNQAAIDQDRLRTENLMRDVRRTQNLSRAHRIKRVNDMNMNTHKTIRVTRID
jgi:hypothetical protein